MTTIATDGKSMAADTMVTGGGERVGFTDKVRRTGDGRIFACAGYASDGQQFARWMDGGDKPEGLDGQFEALILTQDGDVYWIGRALEPLKYLAPMTVGSGAGLALGAMLAGKTPAEAVEIAMQRDIHSGGDVTSMSIETPLRAVA